MPLFLSTLLNFIFATLIPLLGLVLTGALLVYAVYVRWIDIQQKWLLTPRALQVLIAVAVACNAWLGLRMYMSHSAQQARVDGASVRASRERFVLPQDFQYGELLIPAGSLINRRDPFDKGEPGRPLALHGLEAVRFAQPVELAGVVASALQVLPARLELAQDQRLGPVYRYDNATQSWVPNKVISGLACKKGQIAVFQVPPIAYDVQAEVGKPAPDGPDARFAPSQWLLRACENGPAITVEPAFAPTGG
ncbi:hypothetical protein [Paracidovorax sp. MALMAid1276]|uniref:hypothetical protein n=1 Tax=Paracidovorax sp. MALMAid1276 TaxID=3411631 RepID=UPI003B9964C7